MKKLIYKHFIQFTAAMSLCAAILAGTPSTGTPEQEGINKENEIGIEKPGTGNGSENGSGTTPQDDFPPTIEKDD